MEAVELTQDLSDWLEGPAKYLTYGSEEYRSA
jgi:hypothetical protein